MKVGESGEVHGEEVNDVELMMRRVDLPQFSVMDMNNWIF